MTEPHHALPSWNDGRAKSAIVTFVRRVTDESSPDFVPPSLRIAVFDNDGTLWTEQPFYVQLAFAIDRIRDLAPHHPDWKGRQPFEAILDGKIDTALEGGRAAITRIIAATHAGMSTEDFERTVRAWLSRARHPKFGRPYTELVYLPMMELVDLLKANDFRIYVVSGGGIEFMRAFVEDIYRLPRSHVIGSGITTKYVVDEGKPVLMREAEVDFIDEGPGKPIAIHKFVGLRPIAAFGNSDGDLEMLEWTMAGDGARLAMLIHHTDAEREWAYDRGSKIGRLDRALDRARTQGWPVVDMKRDWRRVFRFEASPPSPRSE